MWPSIVLILATLTFHIGYLIGKRDKKEPTPSMGQIRYALEFRVAIHEAGHAVVAWHNPYVTQIDSIEMDEGLDAGAGRVIYTRIKKEDETPALWFDLVTNLSGVAAEMHELGKTRSGGSRDDLVKALTTAQKLGRGECKPPWGDEDRPASNGFDIVKMYRQGSVTPEEAQALRIGYSRAKALIQRKHEQFNRVVHDLLRKGSLSGADVTAIFGTRPLWHFLWR